MRNADALKSILPKELLEPHKGMRQPETQAETVDTQVRQATQFALQAAPALQIRENRIRAAAERARRFQMIVDERAEDYGKCAACGREESAHPWGDDVTAEGAGAQRCDKFVRIPGGKSGFLAKDYKADGTPVFKYDKALADSFLEHEKQIAVELGQWQENAGGAVSIQIVLPTAPVENQPRIVYQADGAIEGTAEEVFEDIGVKQKPG